MSISSVYSYRILNKNYHLADSLLSDCGDNISNFGLIMGNDATRTLCPVAKVFGVSPNQSTYFDSTLGVMLSGDPESLTTNLPYLPYAQCNTDSIKPTENPFNVNGEYEQTANNVSSVSVALDDEELSYDKLQQAADEMLEV